MLQARAAKGVSVLHVRETGLPNNTRDEEWAKYCRRKKLIFVTEDRKIRRRPQEMEAFRQARIGYVESRMKAAAGPELLAAYEEQADALLRLVGDDVPFCRVLTNKGLRPAKIDGKARRS